MRKPLLRMIAPALVSLLWGCNVFSPLSTPGSDEEYLEEARACLTQGKYDCAIENYNKISNAAQKAERLCVVNVTRAGFTLGTLINVVTQNSASMLGDLAGTLAPWTSEKQAATVEAIAKCGVYATESGNSDTSTLLKTLSLLSDCALRMAKTDLFVSTSDTDPACDTAGNGNGFDSGDIGGDGSGNISASTPGMCKADVDLCVARLTAISAGDLTTAGLGEIANAFNQIPPDLTNSSLATPLYRQRLRETAQ